VEVGVFGIGYVGAVSAGCLARDGHNVLAVDVAANKVRPINQGLSPIIEPGLQDIIHDAVKAGRLRATTSAKTAIHASEISFVCVGTPSAPNGSLDTTYLEGATIQIGEALRAKNDYHSVVYRSTMLPGTMEKKVIPGLERASGKRAGIDFGIGYMPEFLRESTAIRDYDEPGAIIFGARDDITLARLHELHKNVSGKRLTVDITTAEAIKYVNNAWHALKISFANEVGNICKSAGLDGYDVMDALCSDHRLNISPAYLKPGFAFGGSCLPKDLRALRYMARTNEVDTPILDATLTANERQLARAYEMVAAHGKRNIGILGLSFKADTDDLRESPLVELAERLYGRGYDIRIFDPNIQIKKLTGANLKYVRARLPHLSAHLCNDLDQMIRRSDVLIVGNAALGREVLRDLDPAKPVVDLVRVDPTKRTAGSYHGICW
jgi:GDP-mannose 6-dehydrogenase